MVNICYICSVENSSFENDPLMRCSNTDCNIIVHRGCYGILEIPENGENWFCTVCQLHESKTSICCELCPAKGGALKRTSTGTWAHIVCSLHIPEVKFLDELAIEPISLADVPLERYTLKCYICTKKKRLKDSILGACISCNKDGCEKNFHVTCAHIENLLCEEEKILDDCDEELTVYCGYCELHISNATDNQSRIIQPNIYTFTKEKICHSINEEKEEENENASLTPSTECNEESNHILNNNAVYDCNDHSVSSKSLSDNRLILNGGDSAERYSVSNCTANRKRKQSILEPEEKEHIVNGFGKSGSVIDENDPVPYKIKKVDTANIQVKEVVAEQSDIFGMESQKLKDVESIANKTKINGSGYMKLTLASKVASPLTDATLFDTVSPSHAHVNYSNTSVFPDLSDSIDVRCDTAVDKNTNISVNSSELVSAHVSTPLTSESSVCIPNGDSVLDNSNSDTLPGHGTNCILLGKSTDNVLSEKRRRGRPRKKCSSRKPRQNVLRTFHSNVPLPSHVIDQSVSATVKNETNGLQVYDSIVNENTNVCINSFEAVLPFKSESLVQIPNGDTALEFSNSNIKLTQLDINNVSTKKPRRGRPRKKCGSEAQLATSLQNVLRTFDSNVTLPSHVIDQSESTTVKNETNGLQVYNSIVHENTNICMNSLEAVLPFTSESLVHIPNGDTVLEYSNSNITLISNTTKLPQLDKNNVSTKKPRGRWRKVCPSGEKANISFLNDSQAIDTSLPLLSHVADQSESLAMQNETYLSQIDCSSVTEMASSAINRKRGRPRKKRTSGEKADTSFSNHLPMFDTSVRLLPCMTDQSEPLILENETSESQIDHSSITEKVSSDINSCNAVDENTSISISSEVVPANVSTSFTSESSVCVHNGDLNLDIKLIDNGIDEELFDNDNIDVLSKESRRGRSREKWVSEEEANTSFLNHSLMTDQSEPLSLENETCKSQIECSSVTKVVSYGINRNSGQEESVSKGEADTSFSNHLPMFDTSVALLPCMTDQDQSEPFTLENETCESQSIVTKNVSVNINSTCDEVIGKHTNISPEVVPADVSTSFSSESSVCIPNGDSNLDITLIDNGINETLFDNDTKDVFSKKLRGHVRKISTSEGRANNTSLSSDLPMFDASVTLTSHVTDQSESLTLENETHLSQINVLSVIEMASSDMNRCDADTFDKNTNILLNSSKVLPEDISPSFTSEPSVNIANNDAAIQHSKVDIMLVDSETNCTLDSNTKQVSNRKLNLKRRKRKKCFGSNTKRKKPLPNALSMFDTNAALQSQINNPPQSSIMEKQICTSQIDDPSFFQNISTDVHSKVCNEAFPIQELGVVITKIDSNTLLSSTSIGTIEKQYNSEVDSIYTKFIPETVVLNNAFDTIGNTKEKTELEVGQMSASFMAETAILNNSGDTSLGTKDNSNVEVGHISVSFTAEAVVSDSALGKNRIKKEEDDIIASYICASFIPDATGIKNSHDKSITMRNENDMEMSCTSCISEVIVSENKSEAIVSENISEAIVSENTSEAIVSENTSEAIVSENISEAIVSENTCDTHLITKDDYKLEVCHISASFIHEGAISEYTHGESPISNGGVDIEASHISTSIIIEDGPLKNMGDAKEKCTLQVGHTSASSIPDDDISKYGHVKSPIRNEVNDEASHISASFTTEKVASQNRCDINLIVNEESELKIGHISALLIPEVAASEHTRDKSLIIKNNADNETMCETSLDMEKKSKLEADCSSASFTPEIIALKNTHDTGLIVNEKSELKVGHVSALLAPEATASVHVHNKSPVIKKEADNEAMCELNLDMEQTSKLEADCISVSLIPETVTLKNMRDTSLIANEKSELKVGHISALLVPEATAIESTYDKSTIMQEDADNEAMCETSLDMDQKSKLEAGCIFASFIPAASDFTNGKSTINQKETGIETSHISASVLSEAAGSENACETSFDKKKSKLEVGHISTSLIPGVAALECTRDKSSVKKDEADIEASCISTSLITDNTCNTSLIIREKCNLDAYISTPCIPETPDAATCSKIPNVKEENDNVANYICVPSILVPAASNNTTHASSPARKDNDTEITHISASIISEIDDNRSTFTKDIANTESSHISNSFVPAATESNILEGANAIIKETYKVEMATSFSPALEASDHACSKNSNIYENIECRRMSVSLIPVDATLYNMHRTSLITNDTDIDISASFVREPAASDCMNGTGFDIKEKAVEVDDVCHSSILGAAKSDSTYTNSEEEKKNQSIISHISSSFIQGATASDYTHGTSFNSKEEDMVGIDHIADKLIFEADNSDTTHLVREDKSRPAIGHVSAPFVPDGTALNNVHDIIPVRKEKYNHEESRISASHITETHQIGETCSIINQQSNSDGCHSSTTSLISRDACVINCITKEKDIINQQNNSEDFLISTSSASKDACAINSVIEEKDNLDHTHVSVIDHDSASFVPNALSNMHDTSLVRKEEYSHEVNHISASHITETHQIRETCHIINKQNNSSTSFVSRDTCEINYITEEEDNLNSKHVFVSIIPEIVLHKISTASFVCKEQNIEVSSLTPIVTTTNISNSIPTMLIANASNAENMEDGRNLPPVASNNQKLRKKRRRKRYAEWRIKPKKRSKPACKNNLDKISGVTSGPPSLLMTLKCEEGANVAKSQSNFDVEPLDETVKMSVNKLNDVAQTEVCTKNVQQKSSQIFNCPLSIAPNDASELTNCLTTCSNTSLVTDHTDLSYLADKSSNASSTCVQVTEPILKDDVESPDANKLLHDSDVKLNEINEEVKTVICSILQTLKWPSQLPSIISANHNLECEKNGHLIPEHLIRFFRIGWKYNHSLFRQMFRLYNKGVLYEILNTMNCMEHYSGVQENIIHSIYSEAVCNKINNGYEKQCYISTSSVNSKLGLVPQVNSKPDSASTVNSKFETICVTGADPNINKAAALRGNHEQITHNSKSYQHITKNTCSIGEPITLPVEQFTSVVDDPKNEWPAEIDDTTEAMINIDIMVTPLSTNHMKSENEKLVVTDATELSSNLGANTRSLEEVYNGSNLKEVNCSLLPSSSFDTNMKHDSEVLIPNGISKSSLSFSLSPTIKSDAFYITSSSSSDCNYFTKVNPNSISLSDRHNSKLPDNNCISSFLPYFNSSNMDALENTWYNISRTMLSRNDLLFNGYSSCNNVSVTSTTSTFTCLSASLDLKK